MEFQENARKEMKQELHKIIILPAKFVEKTPDGKYVVRCLLDDNHAEDYLFDSFSLEGIENPKYLLIGIMTGVGFSQITFMQAGEFEKYFKTKWKILAK
jgi:hypothetical protein